MSVLFISQEASLSEENKDFFLDYFLFPILKLNILKIPCLFFFLYLFFLGDLINLYNSNCYFLYKWFLKTCFLHCGSMCPTSCLMFTLEYFADIWNSLCFQRWYNCEHIIFPRLDPPSTFSVSVDDTIIFPSFYTSLKLCFLCTLLGLCFPYIIIHYVPSVFHNVFDFPPFWYHCHEFYV